MAKILLLNGPNLNLLGSREPGIYGTTDLPAVEAQLREAALAAGIEFDAFQSNAEHELINRIHAAATDGTACIVFNPAGFTHTSVALRDALTAIAIPFFEVHISNIHAREPFRKHSYFSDIAVGTISGCGVAGYEFALQAAIRKVRAN
ncbi:MAG: type II 3-dehydroquinate dehydratase [Gammaproteobacteria bacterium]|nr:type II 3-dehydroquinate dehydratase [Gammaproteobacteria bacterium]